MTIPLEVNGRPVDVRSDPQTPLLYVLRDELGLTAAKFGCGQGHCGACTVTVNGQAVQSCTTPLWSLHNAKVTTLEGLSSEDAPLNEVQEAFRRRNAVQCAYCIPGILMTVEALRSRMPNASRGQIRAALAERHLCRCGTHSRILAAIDDYFAAGRRR